MLIGKYLNAIKTKKIVFLSIVLLSLILRICFLFSSDNFYGAIPAQKIIHSQQSTKDIIGSIVEVHPMLYPYLLKPWIVPFNGVYIAPRALSLLFGLGSLVPFFYMIKIVKDEAVAITATFLLGVFPLHIIWSTLSMEEAPFYFILFLGLFLFFKYKFESPKRLYLISSALLITCSFGFRFESILYPVILTLFLLREKDKKNIFIFFILSSLLPAIWMVLCWIKFGDPLGSFTWQSFYAALTVQTEHNLMFLIRGLRRIYSLPFLLLGGFGCLLSIRQKKMQIVNIIFILYFFLFITRMLSKTLEWQERYTFCFGLFFLIYISVGLIFILKFFKKRAIRACLVFIFCLYNLLLTTNYISQNRIGFLLDSETKNIIGYLSSLQDKSILIDIDKYHDYPEPIALYANTNLNKVKIVQEIDVNGNKLLDNIAQEDYRNSLSALINDKYFDYILYCPEGRSLRWLFSLKSDKVRIGTAKYERVFTGEIYWVYKLAG